MSKANFIIGQLDFACQVQFVADFGIFFKYEFSLSQTLDFFQIWGKLGLNGDGA